MRALFYSVKGTGHVNPTLPLVRALIARGHEVVYTLTSEWKERIEALGARYRNTAEGDAPFTTAAYHPDRPFPWQLLPAAAAVLPRLVADARALQPDLIVYDSAAPWGFAIAKALGCPAVCSVSTLVIGPEELREFMPPEALLDARNQAAMATLRADWGVDLSASDSLLWFAADNLVYSCAELNPATPALAQRFHFVGPLVAGRDPASALAEHGFAPRSALGGRRRVYVSMGTVVGDLQGLGPEFFAPFVAAFTGRDEWELVVSVGKLISPEAFGALPSNVTIRQSVPQVALLPHVDVFVTHAGANSMHEALFFDVPLVCIPCFGDQPLNARRVAAAGAGVTIAFDAISAEAVRTQVERVATEPAFRANAARLGAALRARGGIDRAIQVLTDTAATRSA